PGGGFRPVHQYSIGARPAAIGIVVTDKHERRLLQPLHTAVALFCLCIGDWFAFDRVGEPDDPVAEGDLLARISLVQRFHPEERGGFRRLPEKIARPDGNAVYRW